MRGWGRGTSLNVEEEVRVRVRSRRDENLRKLR
jgi:hypothetical protein